MDKLSRLQGEQYLKNWANASTQLENLQIELTNIKNQDFSLSGLQKNKNNDIFLLYEQLLLNKYLQINSILKNYYAINSYIQNLDQYKKQIITLRYIDNFTWQAISIKTHTSLRHCFNIKNSVIENILSLF